MRAQLSSLSITNIHHEGYIGSRWSAHQEPGYEARVVQTLVVQDVTGRSETGKNLIAMAIGTKPILSTTTTNP